MSRFLLLFVSFILFHQSILAQDKISIKGYVVDKNSGESLIGANILSINDQAVVKTNSYGFFSLELEKSIHHLRVSYLGYLTLDTVLNGSPNEIIKFELSPIGQELEEILISEDINKNVRSPQTSLKFNIEELNTVPVIFGEKDVLKTIQMLPGIAKGGEGSSSFFVRGGGGDQNLILLDEAIVYNSSHLLGFFSSFNSDALKEVQFFKGGIPSQYGGRISSVMDIHMIDGNNKRFTTEGGLGLIASRIKFEGPVLKDKSSFMLSARRTYADLFLKLSDDKKVKDSKLYFYDVNAKFNYKFNDKNILYVSTYLGKDDLGYGDLFGFDWGNTTATVRYNHILNERIFSNTSFIYSDFNYNVDVNNNNREFNIASKIRNFNIKQDFSYYQNNDNTFKFGLNMLNQKILPASLNAEVNSSLNSLDIENRQGLELSAYFSHEWNFSNWFSLLYGVRINDFMVKGPGTFYSFDDQGEPVDFTSYDNSKIIKHYLNIEPRFSASLLIDNNQSIKTSYNRIGQNLHKLTNTTSSLPTDQYVLSSLNIKPQIADQVSLGYFRNLNDNKYEISLEAFYKLMENQIDYRNGADLQVNKFLEGELLFGHGRAYGIEFYLRKNKGRFNGWLSYTLSKSEKQFDQINDGEWFNARQDRTHDLSIVGMYSLNKKWNLSANFVYYTGNAITFPSGKYNVGGRTIFYYSERNGYRMPDYHRLDISATYEPHKQGKSFHSSWSFGIYNVYNRKNAYIIDFREKKENSNRTEAYQVALFGIIPSITWNFNF